MAEWAPEVSLASHSCPGSNYKQAGTQTPGPTLSGNRRPRFKGPSINSCILATRPGAAEPVDIDPLLPAPLRGPEGGLRRLPRLFTSLFL